MPAVVARGGLEWIRRLTAVAARESRPAGLWRAAHALGCLMRGEQPSPASAWAGEQLWLYSTVSCVQRRFRDASR